MKAKLFTIIGAIASIITIIVFATGKASIPDMVPESLIPKPRISESESSTVSKDIESESEPTRLDEIINTNLDKELEAYSKSSYSDTILKAIKEINNAREILELPQLSTNDYLGLWAYKLSEIYANNGNTDSQTFRKEYDNIQNEYALYYINNCSFELSRLPKVQFSFVGNINEDFLEITSDIFVAENEIGDIGIGITYIEGKGYYVCRLSSFNQKKIIKGSTDELREFQDIVLNSINYRRLKLNYPLAEYIYNLNNAAEEMSFIYLNFGERFNDDNAHLLDEDMNKALERHNVNYVHSCFYILYNPNSILDIYNFELYSHGLKEEVQGIGVNYKYNSDGYYIAFLVQDVEYEHTDYSK